MQNFIDLIEAKEKLPFSESSVGGGLLTVPPRVQQVKYLTRLPLFMLIAQQFIITLAGVCLRSAPHAFICVGLNQQLSA